MSTSTTGPWKVIFMLPGAELSGFSRGYFKALASLKGVGWLGNWLTDTGVEVCHQIFNGLPVVGRLSVGTTGISFEADSFVESFAYKSRPSYRIPWDQVSEVTTPSTFSLSLDVFRGDMIAVTTKAGVRYFRSVGRKGLVWYKDDKETILEAINKYRQKSSSNRNSEPFYYHIRFTP